MSPIPRPFSCLWSRSALSRAKASFPSRVAGSPGPPWAPGCEEGLAAENKLSLRKHRSVFCKGNVT